MNSDAKIMELLDIIAKAHGIIASATRLIWDEMKVVQAHGKKPARKRRSVKKKSGKVFYSPTK